jgi:hypothetical protein
MSKQFFAPLKQDDHDSARRGRLLEFPPPTSTTREESKKVVDDSHQNGGLADMRMAFSIFALCC